MIFAKSGVLKLSYVNNEGESGEWNFTYGTYRSAYSGCNTPKWVRMVLHGFLNIS